jgi:uracil-DNA glycosylase family 4
MKIKFPEPEEDRFRKSVEIPGLVFNPKVHKDAGKAPGDCSACSLRYGEYYRPLAIEIDPNSHYLFVDRNPLVTDFAAGKRLSRNTRVGQVFDEYLKELTLSREEISVSTVVHCTLDGDKPPTPEQIRICSGWKQYELGLMKRLKFIFLMGAFPTAQFLGWQTSLTRFYGINYVIEGKWPIYVFPILAPGHILIEPDNRDMLFRHLRFIRENIIWPFREQTLLKDSFKEWRA